MDPETKTQNTELATQEQVDSLMANIKAFTLKTDRDFDQYLDALLKRTKTESLSELSEALINNLILQFEVKLNLCTFNQIRTIRDRFSYMQRAGISATEAECRIKTKYNIKYLQELTMAQASEEISILYNNVKKGAKIPLELV